MLTYRKLIPHSRTAPICTSVYLHRLYIDDRARMQPRAAASAAQSEIKTALSPLQEQQHDKHWMQLLQRTRRLSQRSGLIRRSSIT